MTENRVIEIHVWGKAPKAEIDATWARMNSDMPATGKVRLLEIIGELKEVEPMAIWHDLKLGLPMFDRVESAAVVSEHGWLEAISTVGDVFTSAKIRTFKADEIEDARAWVHSV